MPFEAFAGLPSFPLLDEELSPPLELFELSSDDFSDFDELLPELEELSPLESFEILLESREWFLNQLLTSSRKPVPR